MENYISPAAYLSPHPIDSAMCSFERTAGVAIFEKGSLGDTDGTLVVGEAFLCMFSEKTEKEKTLLYPTPHSVRRTKRVRSFLYLHELLILPLTKMAPRGLLAQLTQ